MGSLHKDTSPSWTHPDTSGGGHSGYVSGNLAISVICGVTTFVVLLILGMPYAAPLALLVAVLDLIPLVGRRWVGRC